jgi:hypothetical protein
MRIPKIKTIVVEWREPRNKEEQGCYGTTDDLGNVSYVYVDKKLLGTNKAVSTFFHELTHVFFNFHRGRKLSAKQQEKYATLIGNIAEEILCLK